MSALAERGRLIRKIASDALRDLLNEMLHAGAAPDEPGEKKKVKQAA